MIGKITGGEWAFVGFLLLAAWNCGAIFVAYRCGKLGILDARRIIYGYLASFVLFLFLLSGFFHVFEKSPPVQAESAKKE